MSGCKKEFEAEVFSGIGEGGFYVSIYAKEIRVKLGLIPYPGTLNTRLRRDQVEDFNRCLEKLGHVVLEPPRIPGARLAPVKAYPALLEGYPVWIVRPDITVYKSDVAEIIADVHLRSLLNLEDGSRVRIILPVEE